MWCKKKVLRSHLVFSGAVKTLLSACEEKNPDGLKADLLPMDASVSSLLFGDELLYL